MTRTKVRIETPPTPHSLGVRSNSSPPPPHTHTHTPVGDERLHGVQAAVDAGDLPQRAQQPLTQTAPARGAARGVQESQQPTHVISVVTLPESRKGSLHNVFKITKCRAKFNS
jgi:hypothetical protein